MLCQHQILYTAALRFGTEDSTTFVLAFTILIQIDLPLHAAGNARICIYFLLTLLGSRIPVNKGKTATKLLSNTISMKNVASVTNFHVRVYLLHLPITFAMAREQTNLTIAKASAIPSTLFFFYRTNFLNRRQNMVEVNKAGSIRWNSDIM